MSGDWRLCVAAFLLSAGFSVAPAFSNPLTDLFNPAPKAVPAPAPAQDECVLRPGKSTAPGRHWAYHLNGHRKCWFQIEDATASAKKQVYHHAAKQSVIVPEESEAAPHEKTVLDARAQMLSAAPADTLQSTAPAPEVVNSTSMPANTAETRAPAAQVVAEPTIDQLKSEDGRGPVETRSTADLPPSDAVAFSEPPATSGAPIPNSNESHWELASNRTAVMLIALGFGLLLGSLLASRFLDRRVVPTPRA